MRPVCFFLLLLGTALLASAQEHGPKAQRHFEPLPPGAVEPGGWLRDWAISVRDGYTAVMDNVHADFRNAWRADFSPTVPVGDWGVPGAYHLEGGGYWLDGLVRLAYALHDEKLIEYAESRFAGVLDHCNEKGIGHLWWLDRHDEANWKQVSLMDGHALRASSRFGLGMTAYAYASGDPRAIQAMRCNDDCRDIRCVTVTGLNHPSNAPYNAYENYRMTQDPAVAEVLDRVFYNRDVTLPKQLGIYREMPSEKYLRGEKVPYPHDNSFLHGAQINEVLMSGAIKYLWTGDPKDLEITLAWVHLLDEITLQPHGAIVQDEFTGPRGAYRGSETCSIANELFRRIQVFAITGNGPMADKIERLFFNAGAGTMSRDCTRHVYLQSLNRPYTTSVVAYNTTHFHQRDVYKRQHNPRCCTAGLNKIVPYFIQYMWMTSQDKGLAAVLYAPNRVTASVADGKKVTLETETQYPFQETVAMTLHTQEPVEFPLWLRVPAWCSHATVTLNDQAVEATSDQNGFLRVCRTWQEGDKLVLHFPMQPVVEHYVDKNPPVLKDVTGRKIWFEDIEYRAPTLGELSAEETAATDRPFQCVSLGPLLFSYPIPEKDENHAVEGARWQYALEKNLPTHQVEVIRKPMTEKWDWRVDAPVQLRVPAWETSWQDNVQQPHLPKPEEMQVGQKVSITLVPYGCTKMKMSAFPVKEAP
ncbi:MAG: glycoside hydrolase family 127 protein [Planctomycetia bacterium]|nr:glycoside hydrolase family 127 protein [Planctomycetia bacterium]